MVDDTYIAGSSNRGIVFVHSRGFKPDPANFLDIVVGAISAGIEADCPESLDAFADTSKFVAYYADINGRFLESIGEMYDLTLDLTDMRNVVHELKGIDRSRGFSVRNYDRLPGKSAVREFAMTLVAPVVASLGLGKKLIGGSKSDFAQYWDDTEFHDAALARVRNTICDALHRCERVAIVSHGTGSVLAWDALWQLSHEAEFADDADDLKIDIWLTTGSPLGDSTVHHHLLGYDRKGRERFPTNVLAWHNVSAEDDYMSHDNTVADDFKAMLTQRQISSIRDYHIYNMSVRYGQSNPHNVLGYLIHPRVSKIITDWITQVGGRPMPKSTF